MFAVAVWPKELPSYTSIPLFDMIFFQFTILSEGIALPGALSKTWLKKLG